MFGFLFGEKGKVININDIDNLLGKIELIDVREKFEFKNRSIKTAKNIPMNELLSNADKYLDKDKEYHIVCQSGGRSSRTCSGLRKEGYNVVNVSGGVGAYLGRNIK